MIIIDYEPVVRWTVLTIWVLESVILALARLWMQQRWSMSID